MKKIFFICLTILFVTASSGCWFTRDWVCTCTTHFTDGSQADYKESYPIFGSKKKNAKTICSNMDASGSNYTTTCEIE